MIERYLRWLGLPVEIRCGNQAGVFDDPRLAAVAGATHCMVNLLSLPATNALRHSCGALDRDVLRYRHIVIDIKGKAQAAALAVAEYVGRDAAVIDHGRGVYCILKCDLAADDVWLVRRVINGFAKHIERIDLSAWHPARAFRLPIEIIALPDAASR